MKKIQLLLILMILPMVASAQEIDGINYGFDKENHTATVYHKTGGYSGDIKIPETVEYEDETYTVTTIFMRAFENCPNVTSIDVPNTVVTIMYAAFDDTAW